MRNLGFNKLASKRQSEDDNFENIKVRYQIIM
jgi:hypothetical protein